MKLTKIKKRWGYGAGFILLLSLNAWHAHELQAVRPMSTLTLPITKLSDSDKAAIKARLHLSGESLFDTKKSSAPITQIAPVMSKPARDEPILSAEDAKNTLPINSDLPRHTNLVGSVDNPTLDGGIIHAADGLTVQTIEPTKPQVSNTKATPSPEKNPASTVVKVKSESTSHPTQPVTNTQSQPESNASPAFDDNWATNPHLSNDLQRAAQSGQLPLVLSEAQQLNLPASVALVPLVESRYHDEAISPKGAGGAWQLMPQTAKEYGLSPEARTNFHAATPAALTLLSNLHQSFGNWTLAFAAYNAGSRKVQAAMKANPEAHSIDELNLPQETKDYVHQLQSLSATI